MRHRAKWAIPVLLALVSCYVYPGESDSEVKIVLPQGDPAAGRTAFLELSCVACHSVDGDSGLPAPTAAEPGPELGAIQVRQSRGRIVTSIIAPSHALAYGSVLWQEDGRSRMGDYNEVLTVRQLCDLAAYIKNLKPAE